MQQENSRLAYQIKTYDEHKSVEVLHLKEIYEKQIAGLNAELEGKTKQYNQLKVGAEGLLQENEDIKSKLKKRDVDLSSANDRLRGLEDEMRNLANKLSHIESERDVLQRQVDDLVPENKDLKDKLAEAKRLLDEEQLKNADLDNTCARLEEDLKFKLQLLEKELTEVRIRKTEEIEQIDGKLHEEYEDRLQKALEELREVYDTKMRQSREDFEKLYEDRVQELQASLSKERGANASTEQELKETKSRITSMLSKIQDLEGANLALNQKIADLAQEMDDLKGIHRAQLAAKDDEIKRLLDELTKQLKEYQNLQVIHNGKQTADRQLYQQTT